MRIGFDAKRALQNQTGLGNYSRNLVRSLQQLAPQHAYLLYAPDPGTRRVPEAQNWPPGVSEHLGPKRLGSLWRRYGMHRFAKRDELDLFHGLSHELPRNLPKDIKKVVTIHDLIWKHLPADYPWFDRQMYALKCRHSIMTADLILCISEATRQDVLAQYPLDPARVEVLYQSCNPVYYSPTTPDQLEAFRRREQLPSFFGVSIGSLMKRKNQVLILQALASLKPDQRFPIVIIGQGSEYANLRQIRKTLGLEKWVSFRPTVPFADLPLWYQAAGMSLYVSRLEGFGLPVLESLAMGTPAIAARASSLPEAGGDAARYVSPDDPAELADAMLAVAGDPETRAGMIRRGKTHAQAFSPLPLAERLMDAYGKLL